MKNVKIIIGASAGDEGKGLATDYFASQYNNGLVVMTNGGSQRAHTVELPNGIRHVFQHFGSGTLHGWDTYYSKDFILNPLQFCKEYKEIKNIYNKSFKVYCDPECMWSTPYDMIYNQIIQGLNGRTDTCGMGIWNTIQRYEWFKKNNKPIYRLYEMDSYFTTAKERFEYLRSIRDYYINLCNQDIISIISKEKTNKLHKFLYDNILLSNFAYDIQSMISKIHMFTYPLFLYDNVIFENGQGLLIDMDADIQFGTPSKTGLSIPLRIIEEYQSKAILSMSQPIDNVEVCYVTRSYVTRHGYGLLSDEVNKDIINPYMTDHTNKGNEFQGTLRFGKLYPNVLLNRINKDYINAIKYPYFKKSLMVTHMNESRFEVDEIKECFNKVYISDTKYSNDIKVYYNYTQERKD